MSGIYGTRFTEFPSIMSVTAVVVIAVIIVGNSVVVTVADIKATVLLP